MVGSEEKVSEKDTFTNAFIEAYVARKPRKVIKINNSNVRWQTSLRQELQLDESVVCGSRGRTSFPAIVKTPH